MAAAVVSTALLAAAIASGQDRFPSSIFGDAAAAQNDVLAEQIPSYYEQDEDVDQAAWLFQQPPGLSQPSPSAPSARRSGQRSNIRLASVPNMLGDCGMTTANITSLNLAGGRITDTTFMLPMVGHGKMSSELTFALRRSAK